MLRKSTVRRGVDVPSTAPAVAHTFRASFRPVPELTKLGYQPVNQIPHAVLWTDLDCLNHVNNTVFFRFYDQIRIHYFMQHLGVGLGQQRVGSIMRDVEARFRRPLTFPDDLVLCAKVTEIKRDRIVMNHGVWSVSQQTLASVGDGTIVTFDYHANKVIDVPSGWVEKIKAIDPNVKISA